MLRLSLACLNHLLPAPGLRQQATVLSRHGVIDRTGVGKSTLLELLARQDIAAGRGFALVDPHGDLVERVHAAIPERLRDRVVYLNGLNWRNHSGTTFLSNTRRKSRSASAFWRHSANFGRMRGACAWSTYSAIACGGSSATVTTLPDILELMQTTR